VKERPILFQGAMVRALLAGTKTQTRRAIAKQAMHDLYYQRMYGTSPPPNPVDFGTPGLWRIVGPDYPDSKEDDVRCPYGVPGDLLWVREAWRTTGDDGRCDDMPPRDLQPHPVWYEANGQAPRDECAGKYRPPMFMPRWACRILLEVTDVRVERLQDISEADAGAEGCVGWDYKRGVHRWDQPRSTNVDEYRQLWEQINGPGSWGANSWVWVVEFRKVTP